MTLEEYKNIDRRFDKTYVAPEKKEFFVEYKGIKYSIRKNWESVEDSYDASIASSELSHHEFYGGYTIEPVWDENTKELDFSWVNESDSIRIVRYDLDKKDNTELKIKIPLGHDRRYISLRNIDKIDFEFDIDKVKPLLKAKKLRGFLKEANYFSPGCVNSILINGKVGPLLHKILTRIASKYNIENLDFSGFNKDGITHKANEAKEFAGGIALKRAEDVIDSQIKTEISDNEFGKER